MSAVCVDSSFLIGLYNDADQFHDRARRHFATYLSEESNRLVIPWPILYETVRTRTVRNREAMATLERDWRTLRVRGQLDFLDDREFREKAIDECLTEVRRPQTQYRALSLADRVVRQMLSTVNIRIDVFITYNTRDFLDVCRKMGRILISD